MNMSQRNMMNMSMMDEPSNKKNVNNKFYDELNKRDNKQYLNITITGPDYINRVGDIAASYSQTYTTSILEKPSDYYFAVTRASIPVQNIPLFLARMQDGSTTNTIYSFTLTYNGNTSQQYAQWITSSPNASPTNFYRYAGWDYTRLLNQFNAALTAAFNAISPPAGAIPPYFYFDTTIRKISLVAQQAYYEVGMDGNAVINVPIYPTGSPNYPQIAPVNPIKIFCNNASKSLLDGIPQNILGFSSPNNMDFQLLIINNDANLYTPSFATPTIPPQFIKMTQQYDSLRNWDVLAKVLIVGDGIPLVPESIPTSYSSNILSSFNIIMDYIPLLNQNEAARTKLEYIPEIYHLIEFTGDQPLQKIGLKLFWVDVYTNELHPLYIPSGEIVDIKLAFIKKSTYTS